MDATAVSDPISVSLRRPSIFKSRFLAGLQCPKLLWHIANAPTELPAVDDATQAAFDQGAEVGRLARTLFPSGIVIVYDGDPGQALFDTQLALGARRPVFEGAFGSGGASCRVDVLVPVGDDQWDLVEVKATTRVERIHLQDVAFQAHVLVGAEVSLRRCHVLHLNPDYVRQGEIDPHQLFTQVDVTASVEAICREIESRIDDLAGVISLPESPEVTIGRQCTRPYTCPMKERCWALLPDHNVFQLYRGGSGVHRLFRNRIHQIADIPDGVELTARQRIQREAVRSGLPHINRNAIRRFFARITYPAYFLDFETIAPAVPLFDQARPYQQIPFQYSLHVQQSANEEPVHHGFLADGIRDPRPELMERLTALIRPTGSVIAYNAGFELRVLRECCDLMPEFRAWLESMEPRVIDLWVPFRAFDYYHPDQRGSASMKAVLPALTGGGYDHLAIQDGGAASREFLRITVADVDPVERQRVREDLKRYCELDTLGMVEIVRSLHELSAS